MWCLNISDWLGPLFLHPKHKTGHIQSLINFKKLNEQLNFNPYQLPKKKEILLNM